MGKIPPGIRDTRKWYQSTFFKLFYFFAENFSMKILHNIFKLFDSLLKHFCNSYFNYCFDNFLRNQRQESDPQTPPIHKRLPRRNWDHMVKCWRRELHFWDPPATVDVQKISIFITHSAIQKLKPQNFRTIYWAILSSMKSWTELSQSRNSRNFSFRTQDRITKGKAIISSPSKSSQAEIEAIICVLGAAAARDISAAARIASITAPNREMRSFVTQR